jgi:hypothetical protein
MMIRKLVTARIALTLGFFVAVIACTDDTQGDDASETEGMEGMDTDDSGDGDGDSGDGDGDSGDGDGDGDSGDGDGDSGDGDGDSGDGDGDGDSGDGDGDNLELIEQGCIVGCQLIEDCFFPLPGCLDMCIESYLEATGECVETQLALTLCVATLTTCEEFEALMDGEPGAKCLAEDQADDACVP